MKLRFKIETKNEIANNQDSDDDMSDHISVGGLSNFL